jgi:DNA-binding Xre family transcriptional regulator
LAARNIVHGISFLLKIGINNVSANKLLHGKAVQINLTQLTTLCIHLNCTPNDLFALRDMQLPPHHALQAIRPLGEAVPNITQWLAGKTVAEIKELMGGEGK